METIPKALAEYDLALAADGMSLSYTYDGRGERTGITRLLQAMAAEGMALRDIQTKQSSLEEIFVGLIQDETTEDVA